VFSGVTPLDEVRFQSGFELGLLAAQPALPDRLVSMRSGDACSATGQFPNGR
jgi:hypothetical protein